VTLTRVPTAGTIWCVVRVLGNPSKKKFSEIFHQTKMWCPCKEKVRRQQSFAHMLVMTALATVVMMAISFVFGLMILLYMLYIHVFRVMWQIGTALYEDNYDKAEFWADVAEPGDLKNSIYYAIKKHKNTKIAVMLIKKYIDCKPPTLEKLFGVAMPNILTDKIAWSGNDCRMTLAHLVLAYHPDMLPDLLKFDGVTITLDDLFPAGMDAATPKSIEMAIDYGAEITRSGLDKVKEHMCESTYAYAKKKFEEQHGEAEEEKKKCTCSKCK